MIKAVWKSNVGRISRNEALLRGVPVTNQMKTDKNARLLKPGRDNISEEDMLNATPSNFTLLEPMLTTRKLLHVLILFTAQ